MMKNITYASAILEGFEYLLENHSNVFVLGQGVWSPWYVGSSMTDLEKKFGKNRVIDNTGLRKRLQWHRCWGFFIWL